MTELSDCKLTIQFDFAGMNGSCMTVTIEESQQLSVLTPGTSGLYLWEKNIRLPTNINLTFSGKNMMTDTVCDDSGNITKDKCVIIKRIMLDRFQVDSYYLEKRLTLHETGSARINRSNYIGFNGTMTIALDCHNVFFQIQKMSRMGKFDHVQ